MAALIRQVKCGLEEIKLRFLLFVFGQFILGDVVKEGLRRCLSVAPAFVVNSVPKTSAAYKKRLFIYKCGSLHREVHSVAADLFQKWIKVGLKILVAIVLSLLLSR